MFRKYAKRIISSLLCAAMMTTALAVNPEATTEQAPNIDENMAATVATLFAAGQADVSDTWKGSTVAKDVIPMYDQNQQVNAYCVLFETDGVDTGYVIISTDLNAPLVSEFSDHAQPAFAGPKTRSSGNDTVYYGGPLNYGTDAAAIDVNSTSAENSNFAQQNISYLNAVSEAMAAEPAPMSVIIRNPVDYLKTIWPALTFTNDSYDKIPDSAFPAYEISGTNACAMYGMAALITFHCKSVDGISIEKRAQKIKQLAIETGFVEDSSNYYLDVGEYEQFGDVCLRAYGRNQMKTTSTLFTWSAGTSEISEKRPILLNMWVANDGYYFDHTVSAYGWTIFTAPNLQYNFFKVRDGFKPDSGLSDRYVNYNSINAAYITMMK